MDREINEIRRELRHAWVSLAYADAQSDLKGSKFIQGQICALERALEILGGSEALVDNEVEAWAAGQ